jgi:hypothetical protein
MRRPAVGLVVVVKRFDMISVIEAPDDETLAKHVLTIAAGGNLRTITLKAFPEDPGKATNDTWEWDASYYSSEWDASYYSSPRQKSGVGLVNVAAVVLKIMFRHLKVLFSAFSR